MKLPLQRREKNLLLHHERQALASFIMSSVSEHKGQDHRSSQNLHKRSFQAWIASLCTHWHAVLSRLLCSGEHPSSSWLLPYWPGKISAGRYSLIVSKAGLTDSIERQKTRSHTGQRPSENGMLLLDLENNCSTPKTAGKGAAKLDSPVQLQGPAHWPSSVEVLEDQAPGCVGLEEGCEDQRLHSHELDEDVEGGPGGVLQWVSDSVSNDCGYMRCGSLASKGACMVRCSSL